MKKLVISGSSKLHERALYWRGYFEGRGYEVIDWPAPVSLEEDTLDEPQTSPGLSLGRWLKPGDSDYAEHLTNVYKRFYKNLDQADTFFLMNEDKDGIEGYIGASSIAELTYVVIGNLNRGRKVEINILKVPSKEQNCYEEVKFWLDRGWIKLYKRPTGKKATIPVPDEDSAKTSLLPVPAPSLTEDTPSAPESSVAEGEVVETPPTKGGFFNRNDKMLDITTCKKRCLKSLTPDMREYLKFLSPEFPAWLLKYLAVPEMQRLIGVSNTGGLDYSSLYVYKHFYSVFEHSLGVALIVWHFTHNKKQTIAALFHDIASPAFKHSIDFLHGDAETQESTEALTAKIIRESRSITKLLKKDNILPTEISDYHLYPIADNDTPNLAADRLEYTLANGLFLYNIWDFEKVKTFYNDIAVLKNENDADELGFKTSEIAAEFTKMNLPLASIYHSDKNRANYQFTADILKSMINSEYLTENDLYVMSEREVVDWILSCGDKTISEAYRQFQRATTVYSGNTAKKNCYCTSTKAKVRYIVPLVKTESGAERITDLDSEVDAAITEYLDTKQAKYVGFDFEFTPYTE